MTAAPQLESAPQDLGRPQTFGAHGIVHDYSGVVVLRDVDFALTGGEIHALLGQNGSGKSTLIKVLTGALRPTRGQLRLHGRDLTFGRPQDAQSAGVAVVHQNYNLFPELSVEHNLLAGTARPPRRRVLLNAVDHRGWRAQVGVVLDRLGVSIDPAAKVKSLGPAELKFVEIARAMLVEPRFLILDEPTASLEPEAASRVLGLMRTVRALGVGVAFVSHRLDEVVAAADRVSVLRDGALVAHRPAGGLTPEMLSELMVGTKAETHRRSSSPVRSEVRLDLRGASVGGPAFDLHVRVGEIVAVTGLMGSGASRLVSMVGGDTPITGQATVDGTPVRIRSPREAQRSGIGFIPEDRKGRGVVMGQSCAVNVSLASFDTVATAGVVSRRRLAERAEHYRRHLDIKTSRVDAPVSSLSGGNQQKVMVARLLAAQARLMAIQEPSQGVDVGGRAQIHALLRQYAADGGSVLLFSTDVEEVLQLADTICVFRHGRLAHVLRDAEVDEHRLTALVAGADSPSEAIPS